MKKFITALIFTVFFSANSHASNLNANELAQYCVESTNKALGQEFNAQLAQRCKGYMDAFFDSMIIIERITGKKEICMQRQLPKMQTNLLLKEWISQNKEIASQTTATVALYAAFKTTFPCTK